MAPIAPGALAESASAKMRFLYSAEYWRRLALTTTSGSGIVLASPGATLRSASLRSASLRSAQGEAKTTEGGGTPFTDFFMSISFSALYTKSRKGRRLTDLGTEGPFRAHVRLEKLRGPETQTPIRTDSLYQSSETRQGPAIRLWRCRRLIGLLDVRSAPSWRPPVPRFCHKDREVR